MRITKISSAVKKEDRVPAAPKRTLRALFELTSFIRKSGVQITRAILVANTLDIYTEWDDEAQRAFRVACRTYKV